MSRLRVLVPVVVLVATVACSSGSGGREDEEPVETVTQDETAVRVQDRALAVAAYMEVPLTHPSVLPNSCSDPAGDLSETGVFHMTARGQLIVGKEQMEETARSLHRLFTDQGFDVQDIRWFDDGTGDVRATDQDGFGYSTVSMVSGEGYAFSVSSPCYQAPEGEDPTDGRWHPRPHPTWDAQPGAPNSPRAP